MEGLYLLTNILSIEIGLLPAHIVEIDPRLKLTDEQVDNGQSPFAELRELAEKCCEEFKRARGVKIPTPPADHQAHYRLVFAKFASSATKALNEFSREVAARDADHMTVINRHISLACQHVKEWSA